VDNLTMQEVALYAHLLEVLCFFIRQHNFRSKYFILSEGLAARVAQLMECPEKHLQLTALKYFRIVIGFHDETHNRQIIQHQLFEPILRILFATMPRDNLLNSACLELFEFIKRENIKMLVQHLVETYREKLQGITYVDTFQNLILRYDQMHEPVTTQELEHSFTSVDSDTPARHHALVNGGKWGHGLKEVDPDEEAYFNASDEEDEIAPNSGKPGVNGASPMRPLVNYPDDDADEDDMDILATDMPPSAQKLSTILPTDESSSPKAEAVGSPPERISEKRRREEDEEDELLASIATSTGPKRRASTASNASTGSLRSLRRKSPNINSGKDGNGGPKKISLSLPLKSGGEGGQSE
jgi:protein phosphatase-4 regulatory subunit 3